LKWEDKFLRFVAEKWVFQGTDPHEFKPRTVLLAFGEDFLSPLLDRHKHFGALYTGYIGGRLIGYMRVPPGTVILEGVMRSLTFTRADTVIGLGTCGALQPEIECGDIVVADAAQAGDCLSPHYGFEHGQMIPADTELSATMAAFLRRRGLTVYDGPIATTGAAFRETDDQIAAWNQEGLLGVELEASSFFALASFQNMKSTMGLLVTDSPVRNETSEVIRSPKRDAFVDALTKFISSPDIPA
jgi:purine-nucleoside phosphorylase